MMPIAIILTLFLSTPAWAISKQELIDLALKKSQKLN
jgi:hypothetical protein